MERNDIPELSTLLGEVEKKFGRPVMFLLAQHADGDERGIECAAQSQDIAAFNSVIAGQRPEVQFVHAEGGRERAHGREQGIERAHGILEFGKDEDADGEEEADRTGTDQK